MLTELKELASRGALITYQLLGRERDDDLTAVRRAHQAGGSIHRRTEVVTVTELGDTSMDSHPNP